MSLFTDVFLKSKLAGEPHCMIIQNSKFQLSNLKGGVGLHKSATEKPGPNMAWRDEKYNDLTAMSRPSWRLFYPWRGWRRIATRLKSRLGSRSRHRPQPAVMAIITSFKVARSASDYCTHPHRNNTRVSSLSVKRLMCISQSPRILNGKNSFVVACAGYIRIMESHLGCVRGASFAFGIGVSSH